MNPSGHRRKIPLSWILLLLLIVVAVIGLWRSAQESQGETMDRFAENQATEAPLSIPSNENLIRVSDQVAGSASVRVDQVVF